MTYKQIKYHVEQQPDGTWTASYYVVDVVNDEALTGYRTLGNFPSELAALEFLDAARKSA